MEMMILNWINTGFDNAINSPPLLSEVQNRQGAVWYERYDIVQYKNIIEII